MNKDEFFKFCLDKTTFSQKDLESLWAEKYEQVSKKGIEEKDREKVTVSVMKGSMKKQLRSPSLKFQGFVFGDMGKNDFGARKKFNDIKAQWDSAPQDIKDQMVQKGLADISGNPLHLQPEFKAGKLIEPDKEAQRTLLLLVDNGEGKYVQAKLNLRGVKIDMEVPMFSLLEFRANKSDKSNNDLFLLNQSTVTEFKPAGGSVDFNKMVGEHLKDFAVSKLSELRDYHDNNSENRDGFVIIKGSNPDIIVTQSNNDIINIDDDSLDFSGENPEVITCFAPKHLNIDFDEVAQDVIFIGRTAVLTDKDTGDEKLNLFLYGWQTPKEFQVVKDAEPVTEENDGSEGDWD